HDGSCNGAPTQNRRSNLSGRRSKHRQHDQQHADIGEFEQEPRRTEQLTEERSVVPAPPRESEQECQSRYRTPYERRQSHAKETSLRAAWHEELRELSSVGIAATNHHGL